MEELLTRLHAGNAEERLAALRRAVGSLLLPEVGRDVNNHIHTTYSFSPYSPAAAAAMARMAGLCTAGIMDHDTIAGAAEFLVACELLGIGGTCGVECRVKFSGTGLESRSINNPDQPGVAYIMLHAVPHAHIDTVDAFFAPLREKRNERNRQMVDGLNDMLAGTDISLDFDRDVLPLSEFAGGGTVTERHIASALATALTIRAGKGEPLARFLEDAFGRPIAPKYARMFAEDKSPYFHYDLIGWIKAEIVPSFYVDADAECADVRDVLSLGERVGAISAYAYLGDVGDSVTGDKRTQKFEDDYLDELFQIIRGLGFRGVTYMPARNTRAQIDRLRGLIHANGFFEISGEDINQPRQPFVCMAMRDPVFDPLRESAFAMVAHERERKGLFSAETMEKWPSLSARVAAFAEKGRAYAGL